MKDEIAENAAEECVKHIYPYLSELTYAAHLYGERKKLASELLPIIAEACRKADNKARVEEVSDVLTSFNSYHFTAINHMHSHRHYLETRLEELTPKETKV